MRTKLLFLILFFVGFSCSKEKNMIVQDHALIIIAEEIISQHFSEFEPMKTINTLMPICAIEQWFENRNIKWNDQNPPLPTPEFDTITPFNMRSFHDFIEKREYFQKYMKQQNCTPTLILKNLPNKIITWQELNKLERKQRTPFQVFSYPILDIETGNVKIYRNKFGGTMNAEGTILYFKKINGRWVLIDSETTWIS